MEDLIEYLQIKLAESFGEDDDNVIEGISDRSNTLCTIVLITQKFRNKFFSFLSEINTTLWMPSYKSIQPPTRYKWDDDTDIEGIRDQSILRLTEKWIKTKFACQNEMMTMISKAYGTEVTCCYWIVQWFWSTRNSEKNLFPWGKSTPLFGCLLINQSSPKIRLKWDDDTDNEGKND